MSCYLAYGFDSSLDNSDLAIRNKSKIKLGHYRTRPVCKSCLSYSFSFLANLSMHFLLLFLYLPNKFKLRHTFHYFCMFQIALKLKLFYFFIISVSSQVRIGNTNSKLEKYIKKQTKTTYLTNVFCVLQNYVICNNLYFHNLWNNLLLSWRLKAHYHSK